MVIVICWVLCSLLLFFGLTGRFGFAIGGCLLACLRGVVGCGDWCWLLGCLVGVWFVLAGAGDYVVWFVRFVVC